MTQDVNRRWIIEYLAGLSLAAVAVLVLIPAVDAARDMRAQSVCAQQMRRIALALAMYANENDGQLPPLNPHPFNWTPDMDTIYPKYLADPTDFACPAHPSRRAVEAGAWDNPACVTSAAYIYVPFTLFSDEQAVAFMRDYLERGPAAMNEDGRVHSPAPVFEGSARVQSTARSAMPVLWDRVTPDPADMAHGARRPGGNVLHRDGHVAFVPYRPDNNSNFFPMTLISAELFGSVGPRMPGYCP